MKALIGGLVALAPSLAFAVPVQMQHQARLLGPSGTDINTEVDVSFELWTAETGGLNPFSETFTVTPESGFVSVTLGADPANPLDSGDLADAWLQIEVDGVALGDRTRLASTPRAAVSASTESIRVLAVAPACDLGATYVDANTNLVMVCVGGGEWRPAVTGRRITTATTWTIAPSGADYTSLQEAWDDLKDVTISADGFVTLSIAAGTYTHTEQLTLRHPDGDRITIVGDTANPSSVVLQFTGAISGISVPANAHLHGIAGVQVRGDGAAARHGIIVYGSIERLGNTLEITNWGDIGLYVIGGHVISGAVQITGMPGVDGNSGISVTHGGKAHVDGSTLSDIEELCAIAQTRSYLNLGNSDISGCGNAGVHARTGSMVWLTSTQISNVVNYGIYVGEGSQLFAGAATIDGAGKECALVVEGGMLEARYLEVDNCGEGGVHGIQNAFVYVNDAVVGNIAEHGFVANSGSVVYAQNAVVNGPIGLNVNNADAGGMLYMGGQTGAATPGTNAPATPDVEDSEGSIRFD